MTTRSGRASWERNKSDFSVRPDSLDGRLRNLFRRSAASPAVLLGAGASMPHLPVAKDLKREILNAVAAVIGEDPPDIDQLGTCIEQPHITLELLCSMLRYRCPAQYDPVRMWSALCSDVAASRLTRSIALLRSRFLVGPIVTTNFDSTCMTALEELGEDFRVITEWQLNEGGQDVQRSDVCALHGTTYRTADGYLSPPLTATARGLARPFTPGMRRYLANLFQPDQPVLVMGYSGQDHYDLNPLLQELLRLNQDGLRNWLWICHIEDDRKRVPAPIRDDQIIVGDATDLLGELCRENALPVTDHSIPPVDGYTWKERLSQAIREFGLPAEGVQDFLHDIRVNLPGAWAALEHYRLYSAGYDEPVTLTFGGIDTHNSGESRSEHLSYRYGPFKIPFGKLLQASVEYRIEDGAYRDVSRGDDPPRLYPRSTELLTDARDAIQRAHTNVPQEKVRPEDKALLLVGMAIAEDYLGLIERKRAHLLGGDDLNQLRDKAIQHFTKCWKYAEEAGRVLNNAEHGDQAASYTIDNLVQHRVWAFIGQVNVARTLERTEAIEAYAEVVELQKTTIEEERARASQGRRELAIYDDYIIAQYPQLWLRGSEWLKVILDCSGNVDLPLSWERIDERQRLLAERAYETCLEAYESYCELTSKINQRYPAVFESEMIYFASKALAKGFFTEDQRRAAETATRSAFEKLQSHSAAYGSISSHWLKNASRRFAVIESHWPSR